jgi:hypothetical protein
VYRNGCQYERGETFLLSQASPEVLPILRTEKQAEAEKTGRRAADAASAAASSEVEIERDCSGAHGVQKCGYFFH